KTQKSNPFGRGTLNPPSRASVTVGLSACESTGPSNFGGAVEPPAAAGSNTPAPTATVSASAANLRDVRRVVSNLIPLRPPARDTAVRAHRFHPGSVAAPAGAPSSGTTERSG